MIKRYYERNFLSPLFEKIRVLRSGIEHREKQPFTGEKFAGTLPRQERQQRMPDFIVLDTETTGLNPAIHSILQIAGVKWVPETGEKKLLFDFYVYEGENMVIDQDAMRVNRLNLDEIRQKGLSPREAVREIDRALKSEYGENFRPCVIAAQNAGFDKSFAQRMYTLAEKDYEEHFERRVFDVPGVMYWLMLMGDIKTQYPNFNNFLKETEVFLSPALAHTAKADAMALAEGLNNLYRRFKKS